jgi:LuxR family maltose regulon positive regulatory protein
MARREHKTTPKIIGPVLYTLTVAISLDSPAWFEWLDHNSTFYLESTSGTFTARRERRSACFFWYAFRRYRKKLYKVYLGRSPDLTSARLAKVAQRLADKVGA